MVGKREDILCPALKKNWGQGERVIIRPREWRGGGGPAGKEAVGTLLSWSLQEQARLTDKLNYIIVGFENPLWD